MNRSVRRSRFQVSSLEEGEPRPVYRRLTFISVASGVELGQSMPPAGDAMQVRAMVARPGKALMPESLPGCEPPAASLRLPWHGSCLRKAHESVLLLAGWFTSWFLGAVRVASRKSCFLWHGPCLCMAYEPVVLHWLGGSPAGFLARCALQVGRVAFLGTVRVYVWRMSL